MILPFTTPSGHVHILRHLNPDTVYLQESLAGNNGDVITHLQTWLRHDVILVVGADGGHGGLADSESEAEQAKKALRGRMVKACRSRLRWNRECGEFIVLLGYSLKGKDARAKRRAANEADSER